METTKEKLNALNITLPNLTDGALGELDEALTPERVFKMLGDVIDIVSLSVDEFEAEHNRKVSPLAKYCQFVKVSFIMGYTEALNTTKLL